jgi:hypothetical protein
VANAYGLVSSTILPLPAEIPDDNGVTGPGLLVSQINVSGVEGTIDSLTVTLDITGDPTAYNGDYYAYVQFGSGLDVLLNNIDNGNGNNPGDGMDVTFSDTGVDGSIQNAVSAPPTAMLTGSYVPDSGGFASGSYPGDTGLEGQNNANGTWTLFIADESTGDVGQLVGWSVAMTAPDNGSTLLLLGMGVGFLGLCSLRQHRIAPVSRD